MISLLVGTFDALNGDSVLTVGIAATPHVLKQFIKRIRSSKNKN